MVISDATRRLLEGLFDVDQIEAWGLKGLSREILAFRLSGEVAAESRFEARQAKSITPLVGREQELALLVSRWEQAKSGEGQVVLLVGEPGIGKSRIALALRERLRQEPRISLRYYGSPYHTNTALKPVIEQLQRAAGFHHNDAPAAKRSKLEALLARAGEDPSIAAPVLAQLLCIS